jgi:hypothetical protein
MKKLKLHYASKQTGEDIQCFEFDTGEQLIRYVFENIYPGFYKCKNFDKYNMVYLLSYSDEIYITQDVAYLKRIMEFLDILNFTQPDVFLQEYNSFESAYQVALSMKETSSLCYDKKEKDDTLIPIPNTCEFLERVKTAYSDRSENLITVDRDDYKSMKLQLERANKIIDKLLNKQLVWNTEK